MKTGYFPNLRTTVLVESLDLSHGALDVKTLDVLPVLLEERHQEVDGEVGVLDKVVLRHVDVTDGHGQAQHLQEEETFKTNESDEQSYRKLILSSVVISCHQCVQVKHGLIVIIFKEAQQKALVLFITHQWGITCSRTIEELLNWRILVTADIAFSVGLMFSGWRDSGAEMTSTSSGTAVAQVAA